MALASPAGFECSLSLPLRGSPRESSSHGVQGVAFAERSGSMESRFLLNSGATNHVLMSPPPATEPVASRLLSVASSGTLERFAAGLEMTEDNSCMPAFPSLGSIDSEATSACPSHPLLDRGYQRYVSRARRCSGNPRIIRVVHRHRQPMQAAVAPLARQPTLEPQPKLRRSVVCVAAAAAAAESPQSLAPRAQQHLPQSFSMSVSLADFTPPAVLTSAPIVPQSSTSPSGGPRPVHEHMLAGAAAGAAVSCSMYPLNTLKTRLMAGSSALTPAVFRNLWRGSRFDMVAQATATAVFFGAYSRLQQEHDTQAASGGHAMLAGVGGALAASLVAVPAEVIRSYVQTSKYPNTKAAVLGIVRSKGVRGLYRGYSASLARDLPFDSLQITIFEVLRRAYAKATCRSTSDLSAQETAGLGFVAGGVTGLATAPIDAVRTKMVLSGNVAAGAPPLSFGSVAARMVRRKGVRALFRGSGLRSLEIALGGAIFFSVLTAATAIIQGEVVVPDEPSSGRAPPTPLTPATDLTA